MADLKQYDLLERIAPFLDQQLLKKVVEYEGTTGFYPEAQLAGLITEPAQSFDDAQPDTPEHARKLYQEGEFAAASELLNKLRGQLTTAAATESSPSRSATPEVASEESREASPELERLSWGKLAADILAKNGEQALEDLAGLQEIIDRRRNEDPLVQLTNRTWLAHWALFVYFGIPEQQQPLEKLTDAWFASQWINSIQSSAPWLLRYLTVAVLIVHPNSARHTSRRVKDLVRVVQQEIYEYSDPVLDFIKSLFVDYDFANAGAKLQLAAQVLSKDFFAHERVAEFEISAKFLIADLVLKVHDRISIDDLAKLVGESSDWVIDTYAETKQDVHIDAAAGMAYLSSSRPDALQIIFDRSKNVDQRMHQLVQQARAKRDA